MRFMKPQMKTFRSADDQNRSTNSTVKNAIQIVSMTQKAKVLLKYEINIAKKFRHSILLEWEKALV